MRQTRIILKQTRSHTCLPDGNLFKPPNSSHMDDKLQCDNDRTKNPDCEFSSLMHFKKAKDSCVSLKLNKNYYLPLGNVPLFMRSIGGERIT